MEFITSKTDHFPSKCGQLYKHDTFTKEQCKGHIEPPIDHMPQTSINSLATQKMIDEHVQQTTGTNTSIKY